MPTWIWRDAISDFFLISKMSLKHRTPYSCNRAFLRTCPQDYWTGWTVGRLRKAGFPGVGRCENARSAGAGIGQSPQPIPDRPASNLKAVTFSILPPGQAPGWPHYSGADEWPGFSGGSRWGAKVQSRWILPTLHRTTYARDATVRLLDYLFGCLWWLYGSRWALVCTTFHIKLSRSVLSSSTEEHQMPRPKFQFVSAGPSSFPPLMIEMTIFCEGLLGGFSEKSEYASSSSSWRVHLEKEKGDWRSSTS